jgi:hypothetical protein
LGQRAAVIELEIRILTRNRLELPRNLRPSILAGELLDFAGKLRIVIGSARPLRMTVENCCHQKKSKLYGADDASPD